MIGISTVGYLIPKSVQAFGMHIRMLSNSWNPKKFDVYHEDIFFCLPRSPLSRFLAKGHPGSPLLRLLPGGKRVLARRQKTPDTQKPKNGVELWNFWNLLHGKDKE